MPLYAHYGVRYLWLVDPDLQTLETYQLQSQTSENENRWILLATAGYPAGQSVRIFAAL